MRHHLAALATLPLIAATLALAGPAASSPTPAAGAPVTAAKKPTITFKASKDVIERGKKVKLKGKISPARIAKGDVVVLKKRSQKKWKVEARTTVSKKGKFSFTDKPTTATSRDYKAVLKKTKKHGKLSTAKVTVAVAEWRTAADLRQAEVKREYMYRTNGTSDGTVHRDSYVTSWFEGGGPTTAGIDLNLYADCFRLETRIGLEDSSDQGTSSQLTIEGDGVSLLSRTLSQLFTSYAVKLDLTGVKRLHVEVERPDETVNPRTALFSPRFLCTD